MDDSNVAASPTKGMVIDTIISALNEHIKGELFGSFTAKKLSLEEALQDRILKMSGAVRVLVCCGGEILTFSACKSCLPLKLWQ